MLFFKVVMVEMPLVGSGSRKFEVGDAFESTELAIFTLLCLADFYL